jgi:hypothetical protein
LDTVQRFEPDSLVEHAVHWINHTVSWADGYSAVIAHAAGLHLAGLFDIALMTKLQADDTVVSLDVTPAAVLASQAAASVASTLASLKNGILSYVQTLWGQSFAAASDGTVTDAWNGPLTPATKQARQEQADRYSTELHDLLRQFGQVADEGAGELRGYRSYLADARFRDGKPVMLDDGYGVDPHTGQPIEPPPPGEPPPGKQWWYHAGTGWKLDDHLQPCDPDRIRRDALGVLGGLIPPVSPEGVLLDLNAINSIVDINQCEGP